MEIDDIDDLEVEEEREDKDNLSLPRATIQKLLREILPLEIRCSNETIDLVLDCCVEFIHLLSSEANETCSNENKKTISPEHIIKALKKLDFHEYVEEVNKVNDEHKTQLQEKPKGAKKLENLGIPKEQLLLEQQKLFAKARMALSEQQRQQQ